MIKSLKVLLTAVIVVALHGCGTVQTVAGTPGAVSPYVQVAVKYATAKYIRDRVDAARTVLDVTSSFLEVLDSDVPITVTLLETYAQQELLESGLPLEDRLVLTEIMTLIQADLRSAGPDTELDTVALREVLSWANSFASEVLAPRNVVLK